MPTIPNSELKEFLASLHRDRGLDLRGYKHSTLDRRIRKRMTQLGFSSFDHYLVRLQEDSDEVNALLTTVLINVTEFFRDPQAWAFLRTNLLPRVLNKLQPGEPFRSWSVGCSSGEEAYSLAITLAEILGPRLSQLEIKIYATDIDEHALTLARRGEYDPHSLRRVPRELRDRYFTPGQTFRIIRDIRRMVVFGRHNILLDAPIQHCGLVCCRNLLIYFDLESQEHVLRKLHYALDPGGILFLGKAESRLSSSEQFRSVHPRWRIFRKLRPDEPAKENAVNMADIEAENRPGEESQALKIHHRQLLEALQDGILVLDYRLEILSGNEAMQALWGIALDRLVGRRLDATELARLCPDLPARVQDSWHSRQPEELQCKLTSDDQERVVALRIRPLFSEKGDPLGAVIASEDVTYRKRLQNVVQQLQRASHDLQTANEELETTNEELQSTNEELETTNEELQSTNEELETTNEELQSVNEELENMNEEMEIRTRELDAITIRYYETLERMPWPVMVVDSNERIQLLNGAGHRLLSLPENSSGSRLSELFASSLGFHDLVRHSRWVLRHRKPFVLRDQPFGPPGQPAYDVHFTPLLEGDSDPEGVLVVFGPSQPDPAGKALPSHNEQEKSS